MKTIVKDKNVLVVDGKIILTQQTEQELNMDQLIQNKLIIQRRKHQLIEQSKHIKSQYDACCNQEKEIDGMIIMLDSQNEIEDKPEVIDGE
ncbi:MAG: hypothetical protein KBA50_09300 [Sedimentibacter sp.]|jgi:hypothetical protein|nr:hypothetical protein [Sedimentibacter sp.]